MNYLKGIGLIILGFVSGAISTSYFVEKSVEKIESAHEEIQQLMFDAAEIGYERELIKIRAQINTMNSFLEAYKGGSDISSPFPEQINKVQTILSENEQYLMHMSNDIVSLHNDLQQDLDRLLSDFEFYIGPL